MQRLCVTNFHPTTEQIKILNVLFSTILEFENNVSSLYSHPQTYRSSLLLKRYFKNSLQETKNLPALGELIYSLTALRSRTLPSNYTAAIEVVHIYFCASRSPCSSPTRTTRNFMMTKNNGLLLIRLVDWSVGVPYVWRIWYSDISINDLPDCRLQTTEMAPVAGILSLYYQSSYLRSNLWLAQIVC